MALGANLGDPAEQLRAAAAHLESLGAVLKRSPLYRTQPVGGPPGQPDYLNAVVLLHTSGEVEDPRRLLAELLAVERRLGRERRERWGPRTIDIDLLDLGGRIFVGPDKVEAGGAQLPALRLPHPRLAQRAFVLRPLMDLDPDWRHPTLRVSAAHLLEGLEQGGVERAAQQWSR
ncbi:MAG: 2-amino-4-hydroxy-6-hydroxymethyldihydropteridine diphosphokinase [Trueperaceae bacterium]